MNRTWIAGVALVVALVFPSVMLAHAGHPHRFMGTVSAVQADQVEVKLTNGKTVVFSLDANTVFLRARTKVDAKELKSGDRVVVSALEVPTGKVMTAQSVQLGVSAPATK